MREESPSIYLSLPPESAVENVLAAAQGEWNIQKIEEQRGKEQYLDTFDWRLYQAGWLLRRRGRLLELLPLHGARSLATERMSKRPRFVRDFPAGTLKERLAPVMEMRALLPVLSGEVRYQLYEVMNAEQKIVLRMNLALFRPEKEHPLELRHIELMPLRGYTVESRRFADLLTAHGAAEIAGPLFLEALARLGRRPGDYSSKVRVALVPDEPAAEATRKILRQMLQIMKINLPGILQDVDTEFLHDFRVAVRRTRSALGQIKGVFSPEITHRFRSDFAVIGRMTNRLRDLDVYLLDADRYRQMLPTALRPGIEPLFADLAAERKKALRRVKRNLQSQPVQKILDDWAHFLESPLTPDTAGPNAARPAAELAGQRIFRRYRRLVKDGKKITPTSPDEALHALRIDCKKLRYLMEFFASLYPESEISALIKQVKKLQDHLGRFNDLSVQSAFLLEMLPRFSGTHTPGAIGCLVGTLLAEKKRMREEFGAIFGRFVAGKNARRFRDLFAG